MTLAVLPVHGASYAVTDELRDHAPGVLEGFDRLRYDLLGGE